MRNFDRVYSITIGNGGSAFSIGEGTYPLHISFEIEKANTTSKNSAKLIIWNLNDNHIEKLNEKDCRVLIRAGYKGSMSQLFEGTISYASTEKDGSDIKTTIELIDSLKTSRDGYVSIAYTELVNWKTIFDDVASQLGMIISYSYNAEFVDIADGFSFIGKATDLIQKGCNCCGLSYSIQNGIIQVQKPNDVMTREVYVISPKTGLIGIPSRIAIEKSNNTVKKVGWDVEFFLNGAIEVSSFVKVESKYLNGYFRVYSIAHSGDNLSGDWISSARLEEV